MKISDIKATDVMGFLRIDDTAESLSASEITNIIMPAVLNDILTYTGLTTTELDAHPDISLAYLIKCQDAYDNRGCTEKETKPNRAAESILARYRRNLV